MAILITGASRGIGRGLLDRYRADGREVIGTGRTAADGLLPLDVADAAAHPALAERLRGRSIELLVCNAGVYLDKGRSLDTGVAADLWARTFAVNVTGVYLTVEALLPNLRAAESARIAIVSSQMASHTRAPGGSYIYRASKAAALNLGRNLASDLRPRGIAVGIYHPGWVRTDMGGGTAEVTVEEAVRGLADRFESLSLDTSGCFETWDGRPLPY